jgi:hypothetical protein
LVALLQEVLPAVPHGHQRKRKQMRPELRLKKRGFAR